MSDCRNPDTRRPTAEIMRRARQVEDTGLIRFVDTEAAARFLALSPHSLECYRSLGGGPPFYKFGKFVRYAVSKLEAWAAEHRHHQTLATMLAFIRVANFNMQTLSVEHVWHKAGCPIRLSCLHCPERSETWRD